jgi:hypothetical protein
MFEDSVTYLAVINAANGLTNNTEGVGSLTAGMGGFFHTGDQVGGYVYKGDALAAGEATIFAWADADGNLHKTSEFDGGNVTHASTLADNASTRTNQITYLGYNGTSGEMDNSNSTYFGLKLVLNHTFGTLNNSPLIKTIPYKTVASSSQTDLALGLCLAGQYAFDRLPNRDVVFDAVCNATVTAGNCFDNNATVVNGATTFSVGTNVQYGGATAAVGDYVRLGSATKAVAATALTSAVYKITAINGLVITVDRKINVTSGTYTAAGDMAEVIPSATGLAADWGVRMDGNTPAVTAFNPRTDVPFVVSFSVLSDDFDTAEVTYSTAPVLGSGVCDLIRALEAYTQFQDKDRHVSAYPPTSYRDDTTVSELYDIYSFEVTNSAYTSATTGIQPVSKWRMIIALDKDLTTDNTDFDTVLTVS